MEKEKEKMMEEKKAKKLKNIKIVEKKNKEKK